MLGVVDTISDEAIDETPRESDLDPAANHDQLIERCRHEVVKWPVEVREPGVHGNLGDRKVQCCFERRLGLRDSCARRGRLGNQRKLLRLCRLAPVARHDAVLPAGADGDASWTIGAHQPRAAEDVMTENQYLDRIADAGALIVAESEAQLYASRGEAGFTKLSKGAENTDLYTVNGTHKYIAHMIGTTNAAKGRFTWAWGYLPGEESGPTIVHAIRTQGAKLGIPELAEADFASEPRTLQRVLQASAAISRIYTPVVFHTDNGDIGYFLIDGFEMPPATVADLRQTIETVMAGPGRPRDVRRALHQYAASRRIGFAEQDDAAFLQAEDGTLIIGLDGNEITGLGVQNAEQPSP